MMIVEKAPAKINLALDVLGKREDNYHNLRMVMTTVDLYDRLYFEVLEKDVIIINSNKYFVPKDDKNFAYKAAKIIKERYHLNQGVKITINKSIPVAAGLAGGSSDAAATIRGLNRLFNLSMSLEEMIEIGKEIGSDVPFCIYNKTAIAEGRGERLTVLPRPMKCWVVLIKPNFGVSTKEIFDHVNMNTICHPNVDAVIHAVKNQDYQKLCQSIGNSLEDVTFSLYPEVKELKEKLKRLGADAVLMSGSGPTIYALTLKERKAKTIMNSIDKNHFQRYAVRILG
jgi:4-diphosphocytidyl-2-C-methyl-D-erythritol kinase